MTQNQFNIICEQYGILPSIALENEKIIEALKNKEFNKIESILVNEF